MGGARDQPHDRPVKEALGNRDHGPRRHPPGGAVRRQSARLNR